MTERQKKTPAQRAKEALDASSKRLTKLRAKETSLRAERDRVSADLEAEEKRHEYLAANPDLPPAPVAPPRTEPDADQ